MTETTARLPVPSNSSCLGQLWKRPGVRAAVYQAIVALGLMLLASTIVMNVSANLPRMRLDLGFRFLLERASFELGDNPIGYKAGESYLRAFLAGLANTLKVAILGILLSTVLGTAIALARLSDNLLLSRLAWAYVEVMRNIPLLLQILFWHTFIVRQLPIPRLALNPVPGVFLSNRGLIVPAVEGSGAFAALVVGGLATIAVAGVMTMFALRRRAATGNTPTLAWIMVGMSVLIPAPLYLGGGPATTIEVPELRGFNFVGGATLTPEFVALLFALVTYQAGFSAETIRSGIQGIARGQIEAARSLGLNRRQTMRLITLPQALRIVVPPLTSQYLSLTKNSSLAVAIGYPDLVRVGTVVLSDTGRSIECISIILLVYLTLSLLTAAAMNVYNRRVAMKAWHA